MFTLSIVYLYISYFITLFMCLLICTVYHVFAMQILSVVDPFENQLCAERAIHPMNGKNK